MASEREDQVVTCDEAKQILSRFCNSRFARGGEPARIADPLVSGQQTVSQTVAWFCYAGHALEMFSAKQDFDQHRKRCPGGPVNPWTQVAPRDDDLRMGIFIDRVRELVAAARTVLAVSDQGGKVLERQLLHLARALEGLGE